MKAFYKPFDALKGHKYDGMIITGAPLENFEYEEVDYWDEMKEVFNWARTNVFSTLYVCWELLPGSITTMEFQSIPSMRSVSAYSSTRSTTLSIPIFRGFDDVFYVPHSRHITLWKEDVEKVKTLPYCPNQRKQDCI